MSSEEQDIRPRDFPKEVTVTVQILLKSLNLPADGCYWCKFTFLFIITNTIIMQAAHVTYMAMHITDMAKMADTSSTISTTFQGIIKLISLYSNSGNILKMFEMVKHDFWPTYIADKNLTTDLNKMSKYAEPIMIFFYILIFFCCCLLLIPPLYLGYRELPLASYYPFHWEITPLYESMYVWQWFINLYSVCYVVGSHDFLFVILMLNLITQIKLLKYVLRTVGTERDEIMNTQLLEISGVSENIYQKDEEKLMIKCVKHHRKLIVFSKLLEATFSGVVFFQFIESASGCCLGIFLLNLVDGMNFIKLVFFVGGHLVQLLFYCVVGNELMYEASDISDAAYDCGWYKKDCPYLRKGLILLIQHAQQGIKITALKVADLNMLSFIGVLRAAFSFSTLLRNMIDKQKEK